MLNDLSTEIIYSHLRVSTYHITIEDTLPSTNTILKDAAFRGAPHGEVLVANRQSAGRGRLGRDFFSPAESGVYMSILLRPTLPLSVAAGRITTLAALATARAIARTSGIEVEIKWVNDLLIKGKKVCGILAEAISMGEEYAIVLGIGINVRSTTLPPELAQIATSLAAHGNPPARNELIAAILDELETLDPSAPETWMDEYKKRSAVIGKSVCILPFDDKPYKAKAIDVTNDGALVIDNGQSRWEIVSGEVSLRLAEDAQ